ncbi:MAG: PepSY-like domain-containing protein [Bacteroidales bacterium]|nr:PepSY-like domain-containing protein [Bacteroidales bacterium]
MKKIIAILMGVFMLGTFASCDRMISPDKLPAQAKQFVAANFNGVNVLSVQRDGLGYDVILHDGTSLEFSHNGQWTKVDCGLNPLPVGVLPANIAQYVSANFPANYATKIKYDDRRYEVDMNNNLELRFDKNGNYIGIDD